MINVGIELQLDYYRFEGNAAEAKVKRRGATSARNLVIAVIWADEGTTTAAVAQRRRLTQSRFGDQNKVAQGKPIGDSVAKIDFFF